MAQRVDEMFAVVAPGLEEACAVELRRVTDLDCRVERGGVSFSGPPRSLYQANLWSRCASRILVRVGECSARDFPGLFRKVMRMPWGRFVRPGVQLEVRASSRHSRLVHTGRLAETVEAAILRAVGEGPPDAGAAPQLIVVRVEDDRCQLSVDSSGALLHRRGFRADGARAPLRETLAAGILALLDWDGSEALVDPMCGSGTFLVEAALIAAGRAPGGGRHFAFERWPRFRTGAWQQLCAAAERGVVVPQMPLVGGDVDSQAVAAALTHARQAKVADSVEVRCGDFAELTAPAKTGLIICNPPYGQRVGDSRDLDALYRRLGDAWQEHFPGWRVGLLCPAALGKSTGLALQPVVELHNGGLPVTLFSGLV